MSEACRVSVSKVLDYLLNRQHERGGPKSAFFEAHGFSSARHEELADALILHFEEGEITDTISTPYGTKLIVRGHLTSPDGRRPFIKSVWIRNRDDLTIHFVTAVPR